jgi:hypothetical protein
LAKRNRTRGLSRLPTKAPTRWRTGFPWNGLDYRGHDARFLGSFIGCVASDHGGAEHLSRAQVHNLERAAYIALKIVQFECADLVPGSPSAPNWTPADYIAAVKMAQRLLSDLGPSRTARTVRLRDYLEQVQETAREPQQTAAAARSTAAPAPTMGDAP